MKKFVFILIVIFACNLSIHAQSFKTHKVKAGETIESIAKQYLVTPFDIYALNPDAKSKLAVNTVLIIPNSKIKNQEVTSETKEVIGYKKHKVKRKETLYSISKDFNIEIDELKKYNTFLYSEPLKKGNKLRIPRYKTIVSKVTLNNTLKKYIVLPKEGKWRVAYKFGITIDELSELNPNMNEVLQPGDSVFVPNIANNEEKPVEDSYNYYEVLPKEGFYRLKVKLGLSQEELEALNPELKASGLKVGMILKVPNEINTTVSNEAVTHSNLATKITNFKAKRLALMMPYRLNRIDVDSIAETKNAIRLDSRLSISLDFHSGVLMALDSAKQLGISSHLKVFDTRDHLSEVTKLLAANDFSEYDAVIGPLMPANLERVALELKRDNVPVISPFTTPKNLYSNVFQTTPSSDLLETSIVDFVKLDSLKKHVVIISDSKHKSKSNRLKAAFPTAKQIFSRKNDEGKDMYYILPDDLLDLFKNGKNIVFLETNNEGFASTVISGLNSLISDEQEIVLMTTDKNKAFEGKNVSNYHLSNLKFHYPSINKTFNAAINSNFIKDYRRTYGVYPNKYAVRGFDLTLDLLLRLSTSDDLYKASGSDIETVYIENKFRYSKKMFGGFYNEAVYVVKYADLTIVEAKH
ncbi:peptidoglycan-binding protein [Flavobacteriales bacterium 34_180_T64]|nr:peptidoglycan-binding protein [Flavobacteriales bacterium 34_180_T64]